MLINKISVNYNNSNINYKGKNIIQKEAAIYKSSLELASKDVIEYFGNQTKKVQNSYNTFLNNWVNEQNKALKTLLTLPVLVAYFSKDKSNKLEVDSENHSASLQTQDSKNIFYLFLSSNALIQSNY